MKTEYTKLQKFLEFLGIILIILFIGFIIMSWSNIPNKIPGHYNATGIVDRWADKWEILMLPIIALLVYGGFSVVSLFPQSWNMPQNEKASNNYLVYSTVKTMLILIKIELTVNFFFISCFSVKGSNLPPIYLPVFLIIIFGTIGYYTWKIYKQAEL